MERPIAVGIDLGTTYSCVGVIQNGKVEIISNNDGERKTPSVVGFLDDDDGQETVGEWPKKGMHEQPENVISCAKRLIGRKFDDSNVQKVIEDVPFKIVASENGNAAIQLEIKGETKIYSPEQISARVLFDIKQTVIRYFGKKMDDKIGAVITIPAYFTDAQRQATIDAAKIAKIDVLQLINEPTAAALAHGFKEKWKNGNLLVYDLGGGTFDVSIIEVTDGCYKVLASTGNDHIRGEEFDNLMVQYYIGEFQRIHGDDISNDPEAVCKLKSKCEDAKIFLSKNQCTLINIKNLYEGKDLKCKITRDQFNELCKDLIEKTLEPVRNVLEEAKLTKEDVNNVVLVGGSTRIPYIHTMLEKLFDREILKFDINSDEAVANGAAILAAHLSKSFDTSIQNIRLLDVIPHSLGINLYHDSNDTEGKFWPVAERYTPFPFIKKIKCSTLSKDQTKIDFGVFEGEDVDFLKNKELGNIALMNIAPGRAGDLRIELSFSVDENAILTVTAVDEKSGSAEYIEIRPDKVTDAEILEMSKKNQIVFDKLDV